MSRKNAAGTPADPTVGYTKLEIDGAVYYLCFDYNAICSAETEAGVNLLPGLSLSGMNARCLRGVLYAALGKAHPKMTLQEVGALISGKTLNAIAKTLNTAWGRSTENPNPPGPEADPA